MNEGWEVFQRDVLDVLRQYEPYMDFFESVASAGKSRPDCLARISREDKKEVWVVDAKKKPDVTEEDRKRMRKYLEMVSSNPIDTGLEISEVSDYDFRGIFVTESKAGVEEFEQVSFENLHQFLQRELVYTETERVVRDVARMMESRQLSQAQARLLFRSLKPYEKRVSKAMEELERIETRFVGLELEKPPISEFDFDLPVEAIMRHRERESVFLFDIPYSREALKEVDGKVEQVKEQLDHIGENVYYSALNTFEQVESGYAMSPERAEKEIMETAGILPPEELIELFSPKIPLEKEVGEGFIEVRDNIGIGYRARVSTKDDTSHSVEVLMPAEAAESLRDSMMNTRRIGEMEGNGFRQEVEVTENFRLKYASTEEPYQSYRETVNAVFRSPVNAVLGKKVNQEIN